MKTALWLSISLCGLAGALCAANPPTPEVRVIGLGLHQGKNFAILEYKPGRTWQSVQMFAGDTEGPITIVAIDAAAGTVTIKHPTDSETTELKLSGAEPNAADRVLNFRDAPSDVLLEVYQLLSQRTVIRGPLLVDTRVSVVTPPKGSLEDALAAIVQTLGTNGVVLKTNGDAFVFAVAASRADSLSTIPAAPAGAGQGGISSRMMNFQQADLSQVLEIYQEVVDRTVLRSTLLPPAKLTVKNETMISRAQAVWLLEAVLHLNGLAAVRQGDKFIAIAPYFQTNRLPRFDPQRAMRDSDETVAATAVNLHSASLDQLLQVYADVTRQTKASVAQNVPPRRVDFRPRVPLTRREATYALELLAALSDVGFAPTADGSIELLPAAEAERRKK